MTSIAENIYTEFGEKLDMKKIYTHKELKQILNDVLKNNNLKTSNTILMFQDESSDEEVQKKRGRPANKPKLNAKGEIKQKRQPTAYNKYMKIKIEELKKTNPNITAKELLPMAASIWREMSDSEKEVFKN